MLLHHAEGAWIKRSFDASWKFQSLPHFANAPKHFYWEFPTGATWRCLGQLWSLVRQCGYRLLFKRKILQDHGSQTSLLLVVPQPVHVQHSRGQFWVPAWCQWAPMQGPWGNSSELFLIVFLLGTEIAEGEGTTSSIQYFQTNGMAVVSCCHLFSCTFALCMFQINP